MKIGDLVIPRDQLEWEREEKGLGVIINTNPPNITESLLDSGARPIYQVCWTKGDYGTFWDVEGELEVVYES
tara:strand:- start:356 stop:571 length:216 start_codon:yes stop_codon:yes gene_type:complete